VSAGRYWYYAGKLAFSREGTELATTDGSKNKVSVFQVNPVTGALGTKATASQCYTSAPGDDRDPNSLRLDSRARVSRLSRS